MSATDLQTRIWNNKLKQGFNTTDVTLEFCYIYAELAEFHQACEAKSKPAMADELADVAIFTYGLGTMLGVTLDPLETTYRKFRASTYGVEKAIARVFEAWRWEHNDKLSHLLTQLFREVEMLAKLHDLDLLDAVLAKVIYNETRKYRKTAHGHVEEK